MVYGVNGPSSRLSKTVGQHRTGATRSATAERAAGTSAGANADIVTLTDLAAKLQQLTQTLADIPAVDRQRIEEFTRSIAQGAYDLDPAVVAEKLATFERLLATLSKPA